MKSVFLPKALPLFCLIWRLALLVLPLQLSGQTSAAPAAPAAAPQPTATSSASSASSDGEVLKVNDLIRVTVYKEDDMLTEARVSKSGDITLPLLGPVHVEGKTVAEAVSEIRTRLDKDYIINPQVTLTVLEYAPQWVTVLGEVQRPSQVQIPPQGGLDLMGAIALAGGYTRVADPSKIIVRRMVDGHEVVLKIDARKLAGDSKSPTFIVQPGDTISVAESLW
ncbi:MAG: polysaccharide export protein [Methylacidiphilales bacterium]|nr:polysaccharide export protein [Candidatus Methylacidiphilales bacterium]